MYSDNVSLLQPTVLFLRVCGVCPSALRKVQIPLINKIYAVVLGLMFLCCSPFSFIQINRGLNDILCFLNVCCFIAICARILTSLISPFVFSGELVKFFKIMESIQRSLFGLNIQQPPSPSTRSEIVWVVLTLAPIICCWVFSFLQGKYFWLSHVIPNNLVLIGSFLKSRVLLDLIHEKFTLLIWHLDDLNDRWPLFLPRPADVSFKEFFSVAKLRRSKFVLPSRDDRAVTAEKINEFNKAHLKLVYACRTLQRIFSIEWFVTTISLALQFTLFSYLMSKSLDTFSIVSNLMWVFICVWLLVVNLTLTTKIKEKSKKVAALVHDLLDEDRHANDVVDELEQFSFALLHRKTNFSAAGFFDFDLKLVSKMASLLAPIILFLVQNQNRPRAGRRRNMIAQVTTTALTTLLIVMPE